MKVYATALALLVTSAVCVYLYTLYVPRTSDVTPATTEKKESDVVEEFSESYGSTITESSFDSALFGGPCSNPIPTDVIERVIFGTGMESSGFVYTNGKPEYSQVFFDTVKSTMWNALCGRKISLTREVENMEGSVSDAIFSILYESGWEVAGADIVLKVENKDYILKVSSLLADGPLSHLVGLVHIPTDSEPFIQFITVNEKTKVTGNDEIEGFSCPCFQTFSFFVSEQYPIEKVHTFFQKEVR